MKHVMIDLETLSTRADAVILSIGAVAFDPASGVIGASFYHNLDRKFQEDLGAHVDPETESWWLGQSEEARTRAFASSDTVTALDELDKFFNSIKNGMFDEAVVWGNGASFDNAILQTLYKKMNRPLPWKFWNDRCYRTVKNLRPGIKLERVGTHHDPRDDAESQARHLIKILQAIG